jgi:hypothetical protein
MFPSGFHRGFHRGSHRGSQSNFFFFFNYLDKYYLYLLGSLYINSHTRESFFARPAGIVKKTHAYRGADGKRFPK